MSHHPERTARNVRPVNQPPSYYFIIQDPAAYLGDNTDYTVGPVLLLEIVAA